MPASHTSAVEVKGNLYTLMSIVLNTIEVKEVDHAIGRHIANAPAFFDHSPIVVDLSRVELPENFDYQSLMSTLRRHKLKPVALRGVNEHNQQNILDSDLAILDQVSNDKPLAGKTDSTSELTLAGPESGAGSMVIDKPVRTGQKHFARHGDLTVLAKCSAGAELMANGNIHVYGVLRGRALCGVSGDTSTRIFCSALEAELVSVAGHYKVLEVIPAAIANRPVQIRLKGEQLLIEPL